MFAFETDGGSSGTCGERPLISENSAAGLSRLFDGESEEISRDIHRIAFEHFPASSDSFAAGLDRILSTVHSLAVEILKGSRDIESAGQVIEDMAVQAVSQRLSMGVKFGELQRVFSEYKKYYRDLIKENLKAIGGSLDDLASALAILDFFFDTFLMRISKGYLKMASIAMELAPVGIATMDSGKRFLSWNPHAEKMTGWTESEILSMNCSQLFRRSDNDKITTEPCPIHESISNKIPFVSTNGSIMMLGKDGREIPVFMGLIPSIENGWDITEFVLVFYDLSAQKKTEKIRKEFLNSLVRDFREPLSTIHSCAMFLSREDMDKDQIESANVILRMSNTLIPMLNNLERLLRLESRKK